MKKILLVLVMLLFSTVVFSQNAQRVNTTLNASTYTAIEVPRSNNPCTDYMWLTSDGSGYYIADDAAGTNATEIPEVTGFSWECMENPTGTIFWVKAATGTPVFTVFYK